MTIIPRIPLRDIVCGALGAILLVLLCATGCVDARQVAAARAALVEQDLAPLGLEHADSAFGRLRSDLLCGGGADVYGFSAARGGTLVRGVVCCWGQTCLVRVRL